MSRGGAGEVRPPPVGQEVAIAVAVRQEQAIAAAVGRERTIAAAVRQEQAMAAVRWGPTSPRGDSR